MNTDLTALDRDLVFANVQSTVAHNCVSKVLQHGRFNISARDVDVATGDGVGHPRVVDVGLQITAFAVVSVGIGVAGNRGHRVRRAVFRRRVNHRVIAAIEGCQGNAVGTFVTDDHIVSLASADGVVASTRQDEQWQVTAKIAEVHHVVEFIAAGGDGKVFYRVHRQAGFTVFPIGRTFDQVELVRVVVRGLDVGEVIVNGVSDVVRQVEAGLCQRRCLAHGQGRGDLHFHGRGVIAIELRDECIIKHQGRRLRCDTGPYGCKFFVCE